jgi:hypothetical protein
MKQPHYITSKRLEDILEQQFGLYHRANRSHVWNLSDLLKQQYDVTTLYRIYEEGPISDTSLYATPYIPIHKATVGNNMHDDPLLHIPDKNFSGCKSWYITDTAQWILWVQSARDFSKAWAWQIHLDGQTGIRPFNDDIHSGGWRIPATETLLCHVREWSEICETAHAYAKEAERHIQQYPLTPADVLAPTLQATRRLPRFAMQLPTADPALDKLQDDIMEAYKRLSKLRIKPALSRHC